MSKRKQTVQSDAAAFIDALEDFNKDAKTRHALSESDKTQLAALERLASAYSEKLNVDSYRVSSIANAASAQIIQLMTEYLAIARGSEQRKIGTSVVPVPATESATVRNVLFEKGCALIQLTHDAENGRRAAAERRAEIANAEDQYLEDAKKNPRFGTMIQALAQILEINATKFSQSFAIAEQHVVLILDLLGAEFQREVGFRLNAVAVLSALKRQLRQGKAAA